MTKQGVLRLDLPSGNAIEFLLPALFYENKKGRTILCYKEGYTFVETQLLELSSSISDHMPDLIENMKSTGFKIFIMSGRITSVIEMLVAMEEI